MPYTISKLFIISDTRGCRPRYQTRAAAALCKDHIIPSLNVSPVWLCITLFTPKALCSNETSPFWVKSPLNVLNFGILPTTWEATLGQEMLHCGSGIYLGSCVFVPSTDTIPCLPTQCNWYPINTCLGVVTSHPLFTQWSNHFSMDHNVLHIFSMSSLSMKKN